MDCIPNLTGKLIEQQKMETFRTYQAGRPEWIDEKIKENDTKIER